MRELREREKTKLKEQEVETLRNLEQAAKLSAKRLKSLNSDEVIVKLINKKATLKHIKVNFNSVFNFVQFPGKMAKIIEFSLK